MLVDDPATSARIVADVDREEVHAATVPGGDRSTASWVGRQSPPRVNQNEITSGRSKRSQTRIAPLAASISHAGCAPRPRGRGSQSRAVVLGDVRVPVERAGARVGNRELGQRHAAFVRARSRASRRSRCGSCSGWRRRSGPGRRARRRSSSAAAGPRGRPGRAPAPALTDRASAGAGRPRRRSRAEGRQRLESALGPDQGGRQHQEHAGQGHAEVEDVTSPKSRSMRMSVSTSTAKPAIAVIPEASTAAPVRA